MTLRGLAHVHSTYSYDGRHSLEELAAYALRQGFHFLAMAEHSDTLSDARMHEYVEACSLASRTGCLLIPGIEFSCEGNVHLLGYGMTRVHRERDPVRVATLIRDSDAVAVVAHPVRYRYEIPRGLGARVHGIEVWNARYDGRFLPDRRSMDLLAEFRRDHPEVHAFGGQDLHAVKPYSVVTLEVSCDRVSADAVLNALRGGEFHVRGRWWRSSARAEAGTLSATGLRLLRGAYEIARGARQRVQSWRHGARR